MNEKNLENINQIDLEFNGGDEDDSFGTVHFNKSRKEDIVAETTNTTPVHTGVIIKFDDDDDGSFNLNMKKHASNQPLDIPEKMTTAMTTAEGKGYNEIDMECKYIDDTEEDYIVPQKPVVKKSMFDDEDEDYLNTKELTLEEDVTGMSASKKVTVATIEDAYLKTLADKNKIKEDAKKLEYIETYIKLSDLGQKDYDQKTIDIINKYSSTLARLGVFETTGKVYTFTIDKDSLQKLSDELNINISNKTQPDVITDKKLEEKKQPSLKTLLKDLQKKHAKSNKKGAMSTHFHFAGNPEMARQMFNAGIGNQTGGDVFPGMSMDTAAATLVGGGDAVGDSSSSAMGGGISNGGGMSGGGISAGGMSGGEGLETTNYSKILREVFDVIGFDVQKEKDGTLLAKDAYSDNNIVRAKNIEDLIYALQPFIDTCIIIPLSISTKQKFNNYQDWCDWYTAENQKMFPKHATEINYCDLLANHIKECDF